MGKVEITRPTEKDFRSRNLKEIVGAWRSNHSKLKKFIQNNQVPFFGLHGTTQENFDKIMQVRGGHFNIATFYDRPRTEINLYQLYNMASYCSGYGPFIGGPIMVFNLEIEGKNISNPWENLYSGGSSLIFNFDTPKERKMFEETHSLKIDNHYWRTDMYIGQENFSRFYRGEISLKSMQRYLAKIDSNIDFMWRKGMQLRIMTQDILAQSFKMLDTSTTSGIGNFI